MLLSGLAHARSLQYQEWGALLALAYSSLSVARSLCSYWLPRAQEAGLDLRRRERSTQELFGEKRGRNPGDVCRWSIHPVSQYPPNWSWPVAVTADS